ncbi:MAG: hypothetical protein HZB36_03470 [Candidatus Omnitrophica bacterium]|nr:hypothetical protein [Candidatus Omnitrophota bacterium]
MSYGLRFNYQQKAQMTAFRRALKIASDRERGSGSAMIMEERSIPDPMSLFGVGSTQTIAASASVTRDPQMNAQAVDKESYMGAVMDIQTKKDGTTGVEQWMRRVYQTAGFRIEKEVTRWNIDKYGVIFGDIRPRNNDGTWGRMEDGNADHSVLRLPDPCSGEIVDFDSCYAVARMLVDEEFCVRKCNRAKASASTTNCVEVCDEKTNPPNQKKNTYNPATGGAWYAAGYYCIDRTTKSEVGCRDIPVTEREYVFPNLNKMFGVGVSNVVSPAMGIQQDTATESIRDESMQITETPQDTTTDESFAWSDISNRTLVHQDNLGPKGYEISHNTPDEFINIVVDNVQTGMSGSSDQAVQTDK